MNNSSGPRVTRFQCGPHTFELGKRTLIMGILNITPDSFSGDGLLGKPDEILRQAERFAAEGADILDIGGESTRPGSTPVSVEEELNRVIPVVRLLSSRSPLPISVDTYKGEVAQQALKAGAHIVNDVWGLGRDPEMAAIVARYGASVVLMHNKEEPNYQDLLGEIRHFLDQAVRQAILAGIPREKIVVDPGVGFGKRVEDNLLVLRRLSFLRTLGQPILVGTSRKSVIGKVLDLPVEDRLEGTAATVAWSIAEGADMVRVHDVKEMARVARMVDAIRAAGRGA
ncbi:MAG: dihydropteroate synthase [Armatimonadetes bacterium]|nr:dihydropteroate synthase [Armatimonadota bacterium]